MYRIKNLSSKNILYCKPTKGRKLKFLFTKKIMVWFFFYFFFQTFANRLFGMFAWMIPVFVALSTFGAVNGILLTSSRLFYAGACEGQMPEILTMIQISRLTPTPAVLCMVRYYFHHFISINNIIGYNF